METLTRAEVANIEARAALQIALELLNFLADAKIIDYPAFSRGVRHAAASSLEKMPGAVSKNVVELIERLASSWERGETPILH